MIDLITVDKNICHGQPCFAGTRIMVYLVLELLEAGLTAEEIIKDYYPQLTTDHIKAAIHYSTLLIRDQEYVPFAEMTT